LTEEIGVQLIMGATAILVAVVGGVFAYLAARRARTAANEIINNHPKNIRDDMDHQHVGIMTKLEAIEDRLISGDHHFVTIDTDVRQVANRLDDARRNADIAHTTLADHDAAQARDIHTISGRLATLETGGGSGKGQPS